MAFTHTPPSAHHPRPPKRSSVHWIITDDPSTKENTSPGSHVTDLHVDCVRSRNPESPQYSQEALLELRFGDRKIRGHHRRPQLAAETFVAPEPLEPSGAETTSGIEADQDPFGVHDLVQAARQLDPHDNVFEKHKNKQYQWVLSLPASDLDKSLDYFPDLGQDSPGVGKRRYFGCNLLDWTKPVDAGHRLPGDPEDKYILLATPIDLQADQSTTTNVEFTTHQFRVIQEHTENLTMAAAPVAESPSSAADHTYRPSPLSATSAQWSTAVSTSEDGDETLTVGLRGAKQPLLSTIEDSLDEVDQATADQMEMDRMMSEVDAITAEATQKTLDSLKSKAAHVSTKHKAPSPNAGASHGSTVTQSVRNDAQSNRVQRASDPRASSESTQAPLSEFDQNEVRKAPTATLRRVARPASLAPPKPLQKAAKQPTYSTFELPGERVARELKEKKAARLSMQFDPQKAAEVTSPQRARSVRSSKPPTVANFELPGERFSRQKKERFEQKLKEEEELARQRRQFKARPSPAGAAPTVRSTFTSRQREVPGQSEQSSVYSPNSNSSPRSGASKRPSATMTPSTARTASISSATTVSSTGRGRTSSAGSTQASNRTTSSSVGSAAADAKRNSVSTEQQQKPRGHHVYGAGRAKEAEKRDREETIKLARQKYAQMSRNLAATSRARQSQQQSSSSAQEDVTSVSPQGKAPQVPKHRDLYIGRNF